MTRSVGVLGGSFDPVHLGHVALARRALEQVPLDEVWFLPAARAVHKPEGAEAGADHRQAMLELVLADDARMRLCPLELEAARPMRSVESLRRLSEQHPACRWYLLLGEDSFRALDGWARPGELVALAPPVVAPRPGSRGSQDPSYRGVTVRWLEGEPIELDSTSIRAAIADGRTPEGLDRRVLHYVLEHGLYRRQRA